MSNDKPNPLDVYFGRMTDLRESDTEVHDALSNTVLAELAAEARDLALRKMREDYDAKRGKR